VGRRRGKEWGKSKNLKGFGDVTCLEKDHLEELRIDERI
jgi:hypothetical protein